MSCKCMHTSLMYIRLMAIVEHENILYAGALLGRWLIPTCFIFHCCTARDSQCSIFKLTSNSFLWKNFHFIVFILIHQHLDAQINHTKSRQVLWLIHIHNNWIIKLIARNTQEIKKKVQFALTINTMETCSVIPTSGCMLNEVQHTSRSLSLNAMG